VPWRLYLAPGGNCNWLSRARDYGAGRLCTCTKSRAAAKGRWWSDPRERPSDDILLAVMCAVWQANQVQPEFILESLGPSVPDWDRRWRSIEDLHPINMMRIKYGTRKNW
jgi:hypothetical protein